MLDLSHEPDLGYVFYPYEVPGHPGYGRFDAIIPIQPTYRHFDPVTAQFPIIASGGSLEHLRVHHPWTLGKRYKACAGRAVLTDRVGKHVEAFTFGGDLQILSTAAQTVCALQSPAPIFALAPAPDLALWLASEAEIVLARQRARRESHGFAACLAQMDPLLLYARCLQDAQQDLASGARAANGAARQAAHFVPHEIARLQAAGDWPAVLPSSDELFELA